MPHPAFELAFVAWLADFAGRWVLLDKSAVVLADNELLKTVPYIAVLMGFWHCRTRERRRRARRHIAAGVAAAGLAVAVSRFVQNLVPSARPIWDAELGALFPQEFRRVIDADYHSFPSDHIALLFPLAVTAYRLDSRLGAVGAAWFAVIALVRVYLGLHYPADLLGGALLGGLALLGVNAILDRTGDGVVVGVERLERRWPAVMAIAIFLVGYQYATLFAAPRDLGSRLLHMLTGLAR
jgi:undecaprenyl-diphosphatase